MSAGQCCSSGPGSAELSWTQSPVCSYLEVSGEWLVLDELLHISGGCLSGDSHYSHAWAIYLLWPSMLSQACSHSSIRASKGRVEARRTANGLSSEPAHSHSHYILLAKVSHKASSDPQGKKIDFTHQWKELQRLIAKDMCLRRGGIFAVTH